jgi:CRISP-associated protein Cas1
MKKTLYIFQNGELRRKDNSLYFETEERKRYIPVENTNDIYFLEKSMYQKSFSSLWRKRRLLFIISIITDTMWALFIRANI